MFPYCKQVATNVKPVKGENSIVMPSDNPVISELDLGEPHEELLEFAKKELNEDPDTRCQVISDFRDLIFEKGEFDPFRTDDAFLLKFLRARRFNIRHAYRLMLNYYEFRENNPEFFENVDLDHLEAVAKTEIVSVPPYREQHGRRILLYRMGLWDPERHTPTEIFQTTMLILELAMLEQRAQIVGGVGLFDLAGITMQQVWYMSPKIARQIFEIMVTSFPIRIQTVHVINQPWIFEMIFNFFKPFLNEKMKERIFIHGDNMESLHKHIDPSFLPERYGGVHPDYSCTDWMRFFTTSEKICWELTSLGYRAAHVKDDTENSQNTINVPGNIVN